MTPKNTVIVPVEDTSVITPVVLDTEMRKSYLDYSMSVIIGRALPDLRDGLKPVHRRILFGMEELGCTPDHPYKKCARIVGDVLGKYHPHGDSSVYDALVRMAQDFSMRYPLVDGHGNFGSIDGDSAAAMRYTEARLAPISSLLLDELDKDIVEFVPNFDNSLDEPSVLPARIPNLLLNGSTGIAVGMATNIPPHNLSEILHATTSILNSRIDGSPLNVNDVVACIKGPDFPSAGQIVGSEGIDEYLRTGKGSVVIMGKYTIEKDGRATRFVITELPYEVNKAEFVSQTADLIKSKKLQAVSDIRDESNREGMRVVLDLKKDAIVEKIERALRKHTPFQRNYRCILLSIVHGVPRTLPVSGILETFVDFREATLRRKFLMDLTKNQDRLNVLNGLMIAITNITNVTQILRTSKSMDEARAALIAKYSFNDAQVKAIFEMRLSSLVSLEAAKIAKEISDRTAEVKKFETLLTDINNVRRYILSELSEIEKKYGQKRKTQVIAANGDPNEFSEEEFIDDKEVMVVITKDGYAKTVPPSLFHSQIRGGVGVTAMNVKRGDYISTHFSARTKQRLLLFTNKGRVYSIPVYRLPEEKRGGSGENLSLLLGMQADELVTEATVLPTDGSDASFFIVARSGRVKRMNTQLFVGIRTTGKTFIKLADNDEVVSVRLVHNDSEVFIVSDAGIAVHFLAKTVRPMGTTAAGVHGMKVSRSGVGVIGMEVVVPGIPFTLVTTNGYGKRIDPSEVRIVRRGAKGVMCYRLKERMGRVTALSSGDPELDVVISTKKGQTIRTPASTFPLHSRTSSGVKAIRLKETGDRVAALDAIIKIENAEPDEEDLDGIVPEVDRVEDTTDNE